MEISQIKEISEWLQDKNFDSDSLRESSNDNLKANTDQTSCFFLSMLFDIQNKDSTDTALASKF